VGEGGSRHREVLVGGREWVLDMGLVVSDVVSSVGGRTLADIP
jgi:hypothetical protein